MCRWAAEDLTILQAYGSHHYLLGIWDALLCVRAAILAFAWMRARCKFLCEVLQFMFSQLKFTACVKALGTMDFKQVAWVYQNIVNPNHMCKLRSHQHFKRPDNNLRQHATSLCSNLSELDISGFKSSPRGQHLACTSVQLHQRKCCAVHSWLAFLPNQTFAFAPTGLLCHKECRLSGIWRRCLAALFAYGSDLSTLPTAAVFFEATMSVIASGLSASLSMRLLEIHDNYDTGNPGPGKALGVVASA